MQAVPAHLVTAGVETKECCKQHVVQCGQLLLNVLRTLLPSIECCN
jgi:hypothetical protein